MKKLKVLLPVFLMLSMSLLFSQNLMDYVSEQRGDTLVIKDYFDMEQDYNSLYEALTLDTTDVPEGRVYMLKENGFYPLTSNPATQRKTVIVGEDDTRLVNDDEQAGAPPLITGAVYSDGSHIPAFDFAHDITIKNVSIVPGNSQGDLGWSFFNAQRGSLTVKIENSLFERTRWVFVNAGSENCDYHFKDNYFVNMVGQPNRRNGGVIDFFNSQDTIWVENNTHVMAQGFMYKFRNYPMNRVIVNHNTFVNCAGYAFLNNGYQSNMSVTNNIFVNTNVHAFHGQEDIDPGEQDPHQRPMGIVNIDTLTENQEQKERKILVEGNVFYWDDELSDIAATLSENEVNGISDWASQQIVMNERSKKFFNEDDKYPYLTLGTNIKGEVPNFTDPKDLLTDQVDNLKEFSIGAADTAATVTMDAWRVNSTGSDNFIYSDWPIPVDLSYDNENMLSLATGNYPAGDLNWFPNEKADWKAQKEEEYNQIGEALANGEQTVAIDKGSGNESASEFELQKNYPNPFNPTTQISFTLESKANVTLKVYNTLGQEVATLVNNESLRSGSQTVKFDASGLASGIYIYKLKNEKTGMTQARKMALVK